MLPKDSEETPCLPLNILVALRSRLSTIK